MLTNKKVAAIIAAVFIVILIADVAAATFLCVKGEELVCTTPYGVGFFHGLDEANGGGTGACQLMKLIHPEYSYSYVIVDESVLNPTLVNTYSIKVQKIESVPIYNYLNISVLAILNVLAAFGLGAFRFFTVRHALLKT